MYLGKNIRYLRKLNSLSQDELAERLGFKSFTTIQKWEDGSNEPKAKIIKEIADMFRVSIDDLCFSDIEEEMDKIQKFEPGECISIPVLGCIAGGVPLEEVEDIVDYEQISIEMLKRGEYFALRIKGNSMAQKIEDGDVVIVRKQENVENGEIAVVNVNGSDGCCKKIKKSQDGITLISLNPAYEPMYYDKRQIEELPVRIIGRVEEVRKKL